MMSVRDSVPIRWKYELNTLKRLISPRRNITRHVPYSLDVFFGSVFKYSIHCCKHTT
jgi:hypothetical protein